MSEIETIKDIIPPAVYQKVSTMDPLAQSAFVDEFSKQRKSGRIAFYLWLLLNVVGGYYLYLKKPLIFVLFLFTFGGFFLWWFIDIFRLSGMVKAYNKTVALNVLRDIQVLN